VPAAPHDENVMSTKKRSARSKGSTSDEMRAEYDFSKARPNRFARHFRSPKPGGVLVLIEPDVAQVFDSSEKVNRFLRATLAAVTR
jgi:hypothetical protein